MYDIILKELDKRPAPIDVVVVGLGFVSFGFISSLRRFQGIRIPLVLSRRPEEARFRLHEAGLKAVFEDNPHKIKDLTTRGYISVSDDLDLIKTYENDVILEMTGTVAYGTQAAVKTINAGKHLVTMNPELQATVGSELKALADKHKVLITDIVGDQPGSLARLITQARLMGFQIRLAGNMKRFLNRHATNAEMEKWAQNKGISVKQCVSFTDGTKQAIEMNLVANYFDMDVLEFGMRGPRVEVVQDSLNLYDWESIPQNGIVDYCIGKNLFPGVFVVVEHPDSYQKKYLNYLGLGEGPRYVLFEPYHLCHLEVAGTIVKVILFAQETINNRLPRTKTIAVAKRMLTKGQLLQGIGSDDVYGSLDRYALGDGYLPVGLTTDAVVKHDIHQDQPIKLADVEMAVNPATQLAGLTQLPDKTAPKNFNIRFPWIGKPAWVK